VRRTTKSLRLLDLYITAYAVSTHAANSPTVVSKDLIAAPMSVMSLNLFSKSIKLSTAK
jgi:hypothetical protein